MLTGGPVTGGNMKEKKLLNNQELSMFCDQMAMIINAGISAMEGISIMLDDATTDEGREILQTILDKCNEGGQ